MSADNVSKHNTNKDSLNKDRLFVDYLEAQGVLEKAAKEFAISAFTEAKDGVMGYLKRFSHLQKVNNVYRRTCDELEIECPEEFKASPSKPEGQDKAGERVTCSLVQVVMRPELKNEVEAFCKATGLTLDQVVAKALTHLTALTSDLGLTGTAPKAATEAVRPEVPKFELTEMEKLALEAFLRVAGFAVIRSVRITDVRTMALGLKSYKRQVDNFHKAVGKLYAKSLIGTSMEELGKPVGQREYYVRELGKQAFEAMGGKVEQVDDSTL